MHDVWDENWWGSTKTLDVHVASLRKKLDARSDRDGARRRLPPRADIGRRRHDPSPAGELPASITALVLVLLEVPLAVFFAQRERERIAADLEHDATVIATLYEDDLENDLPLDPQPATEYHERTGRTGRRRRPQRHLAGRHRPARSIATSRPDPRSPRR